MPSHISMTEEEAEQLVEEMDADFERRKAAGETFTGFGEEEPRPDEDDMGRQVATDRYGDGRDILRERQRHAEDEARRATQRGDVKRVLVAYLVADTYRELAERR